MIEISGSIVASLAKEGISALLRSPKNEGINTSQIEAALQKHVTWTHKWSHFLQTIEMPQPEDLDSATIPLTLTDQPRRFRSTSMGREQVYTETDLLTSLSNKIVLGDPGAGKTTTLRRIVRLQFDELLEGLVDTSFPIVIEMRSLTGSMSLVDKLIEVLCISYEKGGEEVVTRNSPTVHRKMRSFVVDFLNTSRALLILDGLDEVASDKKTDIEVEISELSDELDECCVISSCRSGDYSYQISNCDLYEILPLSEEQIKEVARAWLPKLEDSSNNERGKSIINPSEVFYSRLKQTNYFDLVDRPLFLFNLIIIFRSEGDLPARPVDAIRKITQIVLKSWDKQRGVERHSKYSGFDVDRKLDFLSSISFVLTFKEKKKAFSSRSLLTAYEQVRERFNLPAREAEEVVQEIESHIGIVTYTSFDNYEFSHLSVQEYLAASYIVKLPINERVIGYLLDYPACIAVASAISSEPEAWIANLIYYCKPMLVSDQLPRRSLESFLARLELERPEFSPSLGFGLAIVRLMSHLYAENTKTVADTRHELIMSQAAQWLMSKPAVQKSVSIALREYILDEQLAFSSEVFSREMKFLRAGKKAPLGDLMPSQITYPLSFMVMLSDACSGDLSITVQSKEGQLVVVPFRNFSREQFLQELGRTTKSRVRR